MADARGHDEITTRKYQEGDDEGIVALLQAAFPFWAKMKKPLEYWRWKYLRTPFQTHIVVSTVGEKIEGVGHCIKMRVKLGNRVLISYYDDDYATYPEYRKKGIYRAVTNYTDVLKREGCADFCYWITSNPVVLTKAMIHEQVSFPTPFSDLVRIRDIDHFIEKVPVEEAKLLKEIYHSQKPSLSSRQKYSQNQGFDLLDVSSFDEKFDTLWDEESGEYNYILMRNRDFMNWRFTQNPSKKYTIKAALSEGKVIGYVVLEVDDFEGYIVGSIYDLLPARGHDDILGPLFRRVVDYFDDINVDCISLTTMLGHPYQKIASSHGFIDAPYTSETYVMFWGYNDFFYNALRDLKPDKIYFSYSDYF